MSTIKNIIVHCSDSFWGCAREIRKWHMKKGWRDIGYHLVIGNGKPVSSFYLRILDGEIECGRYLDEDLTLDGKEVGAHAFGYNGIAIGICLIGKEQFTSNQMLKLFKLCKELMTHYDLTPDSVIGHYETVSGKEQGKTCPNIDMEQVRNKLWEEMVC